MLFDFYVNVKIIMKKRIFLNTDIDNIILYDSDAEQGECVKKKNMN